MVSKNGTFRAVYCTDYSDAIFFEVSKKPLCIIIGKDMLQWLYVGYIEPSHLRELADFLEKLNEQNGSNTNG